MWGLSQRSMNMPAPSFEHYISHDLFLEWLLELNHYENHC